MLFVPFLEFLGVKFFRFSRFCVHVGRGVTLLFGCQVVPEVTCLLLEVDTDLAEGGLVAEQFLVEDVPVGDENVLLLLERRQGRPGPGLAGGDGRRGLRDIFCHGTAESKVIFDLIESARPAVASFSPMGPGLSDCIFWLSTVFCVFFLVIFV